MNNTVAADPFAAERPRLTAFYPREAALNVRDAWSVWNGYKFADCYYDAEYEYFCIRNGCGTYDICPMQKYEIAGADAERMLNRMITRDLGKIRINRVAYCLWCTDEGRVIDDGTVFRLADDRFMLTCGSPCTAWLVKSAYGFDDVTVTDVSDTLAALSVQGPSSFAILKRMGLSGLESVKPFDIHHVNFHGAPLRISRTGFTGDLGYELWIDPELALTLWDELYAAGEDYGIQPYGEAATDMARLEAGFIMPHREFNEALKTVHFEHDQTPFELGLDWLVDFDKPHFSGRTALLREKEAGPKYRLVKLDIPGNKIAEGSILYNNRRCSRDIGYVTSAMWSPAVKANIAFAMLRTPALGGEIWAEIYHYKELRPYRKMALCRVLDKPFWAPARARATPPAPV